MLDVPETVSRTLGQRGRVPVRASVNGVAFTSSLMPTAEGGHCLGVTKAQLREAGAAQGDAVQVELALDTTPRVITPPDDFARALQAAPEARSVFEGLSYTHRREYVRWIESAKREATRQRRVEGAIELLQRGVKTPDAPRAG